MKCFISKSIFRTMIVMRQTFKLIKEIVLCKSSTGQWVSPEPGTAKFTFSVLVSQTPLLLLLMFISSIWHENQSKKSVRTARMETTKSKQNQFYPRADVILSRSWRTFINGEGVSSWFRSVDRSSQNTDIPCQKATTDSPFIIISQESLTVSVSVSLCLSVCPSLSACLSLSLLHVSQCLSACLSLPSPVGLSWANGFNGK